MLPQDNESPPDVTETARENFYSRLLKKGVKQPILCYYQPDYVLDFAWPEEGYCILLQKFDPKMHNKITADGWKVFYFPGREMFRAESYDLIASALPKAKAHSKD